MNSRYIFPAILAAVLLPATHSSAVPFQEGGAGAAAPYCQIADNRQDPMYSLSLADLFEEKIEGFGDTSVLELKADWEFAYYRSPEHGDISMGLDVQLTYFADSAGVQLPDQLLKLAVDSALTWRGAAGYSYRFEIAPGVYSDLEELNFSALSFPFALSAIRAFTPQVSGLVGLELRPEWDLVVKPRLGIAWEVSPTLWVQAMIPESRVIWAATDNWQVYGGIVWNNVDYELREKGGLDRGRLTVEDIRMTLGVMQQVSSGHHLSVEIGQSVERDLEFEQGTESIPASLNIDDAFFFGLILGGPF